MRKDVETTEPEEVEPEPEEVRENSASVVAGKKRMTTPDAQTIKLQKRLSILEDLNDELKSNLSRMEDLLDQTRRVKSPRPDSKKTLFDELNEMIGL